MTAHRTCWPGVVLLVGLLVLSGVASAEAERARDAVDRGVAHFQKGEFDKAIADFTEAIRNNPKSAEAYYHRATAHRMKLDNLKAIADYTEAIRLAPALGRAYYCRGIIYRMEGKLAKAEADFAKAAELGCGPAVATSVRLPSPPKPADSRSVTIPRLPSAKFQAPE